MLLVEYKGVKMKSWDYGRRNQREVVAEFADGVNAGHLIKESRG